MSEKFEATWQKRFMQGHYSYRDSHVVATQVLTEAQAAALALVAIGAGQASTVAYYVFGTNARAKLNPFAVPPFSQPYGAILWPASCYAREVKFYCDQDAYVSIVSVNPDYLKEATIHAYTKVVPTAPQLLFEAEQPLPMGEQITFSPTYGYSVVFRAATVSGTLSMWVEGNVEGGE